MCEHKTASPFVTANKELGWICNKCGANVTGQPERTKEDAYRILSTKSQESGTSFIDDLGLSPTTFD